jgi:hypothetical protein
MSQENKVTMAKLCSGMSADELRAFNEYQGFVAEYIAAAPHMAKQSVSLTDYVGSALRDGTGVWPDAISDRAGVMMPPDLASALSKAETVMQQYVPLLSKTNPLSFQ